MTDRNEDAIKAFRELRQALYDTLSWEQRFALGGLMGGVAHYYADACGVSGSELLDLTGPRRPRAEAEPVAAEGGGA